jgi:hypothetical protein
MNPKIGGAGFLNPQIASGGDTLTTVLVAGNATGGTDIDITEGDGFTGTATGSSGTDYLFDFQGTVNGSGTHAYTGILYNSTETATGSGAKLLLDLQVATVSKFSVSNVGDAACRVLAASSQVTAPVVGDSGNYFSIRTSADDGAMFAIGNGNGTVNRHLLFTDYANRAKDHDHDTLSTNPTVFIHSATDPDVSNNQYLQLSHDQADAVISTGPATGAGSGPTTIRNALKIDATLVSTEGRIQNRTAATTNTYTTGVADYIIGATATATTAQHISIATATETEGRVIIFKDEGGNASANNIDISTAGASVIDGAASVTIATDYASVSMYFDGTNWMLY